MMHFYRAVGFRWIFQIIIFVLLFVIFWWIIKGSSPGSAKEILDKRLAKGEIDIKEYKKLKKEIE